VLPELVLEYPSEVHPFKEELDGDATAKLSIPGSFVTQIAHPLRQILHKGQSIRIFKVTQIKKEHFVFQYSLFLEITTLVT